VGWKDVGWEKVCQEETVGLKDDAEWENEWQEEAGE